MFYCVLLLLLFSLVMVIRGYQTRYCWVFLIMLAGMIISFLSIFIYLTLFSDYVYGDFSFFNPDYLFFRLVRSKIKLPLSVLARIMNAGLGLYLLAIPLFVLEFTENKQAINGKILFLLVFCVYYLVFYDPENAYHIYLRYHLDAMPQRYSYILDLVHQFNQIGLVLYLFYPSYLLYVYISEINIRFIKRQMIVLAICLVVMTLLFYGVVFFSPFILSVDNAVNYGFWIYHNISNIKTYYMVLPLVTASALFLVFFSFLNFRLGSRVGIFTNRRTGRIISHMNEHLSDSLHSQKNILFSINIMAREAAGDDPEKLRTGIRKIENLSRSVLEKISEQLDSLKEIRIKFENQELVELVEKAAEKVNLPAHIEIFKNYRAKDRRDLACRLDPYHITQVFVNVISNAVEAIEAAGRDEGLIVITVTTQFQWVLVSIQDNGIGIRKKSLRHIFEPWYSEKKGRYNKGLGLSYVYEVINAHFGIVKFESRYGEGSTVYIMLPRSETIIEEKEVKYGENQNPDRRR